MSRCFPFPPPGYETKATLEHDVDLKIKEKDKEKKHKDKKDKKDKKERSERKEKERSEDKNKEDKDRKRKKHEDKKDKKKDKSSSSEEKKHEDKKEKRKDKSSPSEEKKTGASSSDNQNREKLGPNSKQSTSPSEEKKHEDKKDKKKDKSSSSEEKKTAASSLDNRSSEKLGPDSIPSNGVQDYRVLVELGKRVRNDGGATDNQKVQKITVTEQRKVHDDNQKVQKITFTEQRKVHDDDDIKNKSEHSWMANGQSGSIGECSGQNQIKVKDKNENENENNLRKGDSDKNQKRERDKNRKAEEKKRKKERKEEKKKEKKRKEEKKDKKKEKNKEKKIEATKTDGNFLDSHDNNNPLDLLKKSHDSQGKLTKYKEPHSNGLLHDNGFQPNNMSRPTLSSRQVSQNGSGFHPSQNNSNLAVEKGAVITNAKNADLGRAANSTKSATMDDHVVKNGLMSLHVVGSGHKTEPCKTTDLVKVEPVINNYLIDGKHPTSHPLVENGRKMVVDKQGSNAIHDMGNKEVRMNGVLEGKVDKSSTPSSVSAVKIKEKEVTMSMKPPPSHPDLKYLSEILTVPTVEWAQSDDQEWLFGCEDWDSQPKRPKRASSQIEWTKPVWAEAIRMESAEVTVMPYVIPY